MGFAPATFLQMCKRHQNIKTALGLTDAQIHVVIVLSSRRRERVRWEAKLELALDKEVMVPFFGRRDFLIYVSRHGTVPSAPYCRIEIDGGIRLVSGLSGVALATLQTRVTNALVGEETTDGVSAVTVE